MLPMGLLFLNLLHYKQKFVSIKMEQNFQTKYWHLTKNKHMRRKSSAGYWDDSSNRLKMVFSSAQLLALVHADNS